MYPGSGESTPRSKGWSVRGEIMENKPPVPFLAQAGAQVSRRLDPSAKWKLELGLVPCYSAAAFQCCSYVCCLERVEMHSGGHGGKIFPSELICLWKTQSLFTLLFCSQSERQGGWTMLKGSAAGRSFILWHTQWSTSWHRFSFFLLLSVPSFPKC